MRDLIAARDRVCLAGREALGLRFERKDRRRIYERLASGETEEQIIGVWTGTGIRAELEAADELEIAPDEPGEESEAK